MRLIFTIFTMILLLIGCSKSEESSPSAPQPVVPSWSFSAMVDGVLFYADSAKGYMLIDSSNGFPVRVFLIDGFCQGNNIVPAFGDISNSTTLTTLYYSTIAAGAQFQYYPLNDSINTFEHFEASFKISAVDIINQKLSGEFSGILIGDVTNDTVVITNGTFTNILYEIL